MARIPETDPPSAAALANPGWTGRSPVTAYLPRIGSTPRGPDRPRHAALPDGHFVWRTEEPCPTHN
ncbi:hypothetical protein ACQF36_03545 [Streptomyces sp. Marseille-Q5077]|uniref:hypothetical protein n=1 Tax=Streptomyces sp. Marseille-Q5077 TaxID=3418995 RepID=UPI003D067179